MSMQRDLSELTDPDVDPFSCLPTNASARQHHTCFDDTMDSIYVLKPPRRLTALGKQAAVLQSATDLRDMRAIVLECMRRWEEGIAPPWGYEGLNKPEWVNTIRIAFKFLTAYGARHRGLCDAWGEYVPNRADISAVLDPNWDRFIWDDICARRKWLTAAPARAAREWRQLERAEQREDKAAAERRRKEKRRVAKQLQNQKDEALRKQRLAERLAARAVDKARADAAPDVRLRVALLQLRDKGAVRHAEVVAWATHPDTDIQEALDFVLDDLRTV